MCHKQAGPQGAGHTCAAAIQEGPPPPSVVFHRQLEVGQRNRDECCHDDEDEKHNGEDTVDGVHLRQSNCQTKASQRSNSA